MRTMWTWSFFQLSAEVFIYFFQIRWTVIATHHADLLSNPDPYAISSLTGCPKAELCISGNIQTHFNSWVIWSILPCLHDLSEIIALQLQAGIKFILFFFSWVFIYYCPGTSEGNSVTHEDFILHQLIGKEASYCTAFTQLIGKETFGPFSQVDPISFT